MLLETFDTPVSRSLSVLDDSSKVHLDCLTEASRVDAHAGEKGRVRSLRVLGLMPVAKDGVARYGIFFVYVAGS